MDTLKYQIKKHIHDTDLFCFCWFMHPSLIFMWVFFGDEIKTSQIRVIVINKRDVRCSATCQWRTPSSCTRWWHHERAPPSDGPCRTRRRTKTCRAHQPQPSTWEVDKKKKVKKKVVGQNERLFIFCWLLVVDRCVYASFWQQQCLAVCHHHHHPHPHHHEDDDDEKDVNIKKSHRERGKKTYFSISRSGIPPSSKRRRPVVVDLPESTWPQMTMDMWVCHKN